ncbi:MAG: TrmO family methyltransferase domain-containing protein, partial [Planctomycetota bacterium]
NVVGHKILIRDHDLLHGTPVLDIKPYLPYCDAHPQAKAGWVDELTAPGPDHRWD